MIALRRLRILDGPAQTVQPEGVEEIAGRKLPHGICPPPYEHCTAEDLELIEEASAGRTEFAQQHDPNLIRAQRLVAERDAQLRDYADALARAEALVQQRDNELRQLTGSPQ